MVTGKENYTRAIEFKGPAYLPCTIGANLDWLYNKDERKRERVRELAACFPHDMLGWVSPKDFGVDLGTRDGVRRWRDQWGTGWSSTTASLRRVSAVARFHITPALIHSMDPCEPLMKRTANRCGPFASDRSTE